MDENVRIIDARKEGTPDNRSTMYIAGDFTLSSVRAEPSPTTFVSEVVRDRIRSADVSLVNYEGVTATGLEPAFKGGPLVEIDKRCPNLLAETGFTGVTLANNHVVDYGPEGILETTERCRDAGLDTLGTGENVQEAISPARFSLGDTTVSVFNFSENPIHSYAIDDSNPSIADISHPGLIQKITEEKRNADVLIAVAHAGFMWVPIPPAQLQQRYRRFLDLGVDVVVGHHPHVPQGWEAYEDGVIFYSLGNFLYDRAGRQTSHPEKWGLALELSFGSGSVESVGIIPLEVVDRRVHPLGGNRSYRKHIDRLERMSDVVEDQEELAAMWMVLADKYFGDKRDEIVNDPEVFLYRVIWPSHQAMLETALLRRAADMDVPVSVRKEALRMWRWSNVDPFETRSTKIFKKLARTAYSGPIRYFSHETGLHPHILSFYRSARDNLRRREK